MSKCEAFEAALEENKQGLKNEVMFDYVDPSSGLLMGSPNQNAVYNELTGVTTFLIN